MIIEKKQQDPLRYAFGWLYFDSARAGLKRVLRAEAKRGRKILVPAYVGQSSREGSGVFDPIRETRTPFRFYRLDERLRIDRNDLEEKLRRSPGQMLLLIHYFGFKDPALATIKRQARRLGMTLIEDFAQAFFTFWQDPVQDFDYALFSIHKLFPADSGGMVIDRKGTLARGQAHGPELDLFGQDLRRIADQRIRNYERIRRALSTRAKALGITLLRGKPGGAVPQTFPILLPDTRLRDRLYFQLNAEGYGVVSLYHELVQEIDASFDVERDISGRILNLPVHQDAGGRDLDRLLQRMAALIRDHRREVGR